MIRSRARRSTTRSLITGNGSARHGSMTISSPSSNERMCSWQVVVTSGPWASPLIISPHAPQMPSRQSESKATGSSPLPMSSSLRTSSISRNDMSSETSSSRYVAIAPGEALSAWRQILSPILMAQPSLVAPRLQLDELVGEVLLVQHRRLTCTGPLPGCDVGVLLVVAQRLAVLGLRLGPEVAAARLAPVEGVDAHQLAELEEVGDPAGLLEGLVEALCRPEDLDVAVEVLAQAADQ